MSRAPPDRRRVRRRSGDGALAVRAARSARGPRRLGRRRGAPRERDRDRLRRLVRVVHIGPDDGARRHRPQPDGPAQPGDRRADRVRPHPGGARPGRPGGARPLARRPARRPHPARTRRARRRPAGGDRARPGVDALRRPRVRRHRGGGRHRRRGMASLRGAHRLRRGRRGAALPDRHRRPAPAGPAARQVGRGHATHPGPADGGGGRDDRPRLGHPAHHRARARRPGLHRHAAGAGALLERPAGAGRALATGRDHDPALPRFGARLGARSRRRSRPAGRRAGARAARHLRDLQHRRRAAHDRRPARARGAGRLLDLLVHQLPAHDPRARVALPALPRRRADRGGRPHTGVPLRGRRRQRRPGRPRPRHHVPGGARPRVRDVGRLRHPLLAHHVPDRPRGARPRPARRRGRRGEDGGDHPAAARGARDQQGGLGTRDLAARRPQPADPRDLRRGAAVAAARAGPVPQPGGGYALHRAPEPARATTSRSTAVGWWATRPPRRGRAPRWS